MSWPSLHLEPSNHVNLDAKSIHVFGEKSVLGPIGTPARSTLYVSYVCVLRRSVDRQVCVRRVYVYARYVAAELICVLRRSVGRHVCLCMYMWRCMRFMSYIYLQPSIYICVVYIQCEREWEIKREWQRKRGIDVNMHNGRRTQHTKDVRRLMFHVDRVLEWTDCAFR